MTDNDITSRVVEAFGLVPTEEQHQAIKVYSSFINSCEDASVMIMRGCAGTGKTSLAGAMVRAARRIGMRTSLLAPTGRAAKVFALTAGKTAATIHRRIYRQKTFEGGFALAPNMSEGTLFIVDEASMIANDGSGDTVFASGRLLDDLVAFVYGGRSCRLMLIGDRAQLPPVAEEVSPALSAEFMRSYGLKVFECDLNDVVRQSHSSGILMNATEIRRLADEGADIRLPRVLFRGYKDIVRVAGNDLIESLAESYREVGIDETIVVTRSNRRANIYNQGIRSSILGREEALSSGDILMIVRNNYYWAAQSTDGDTLATPVSMSRREDKDSYSDEGTKLSFLANGDRAIVKRARNFHALHGFSFVDLTITLPDYDNYCLQATAITDSLTTEAPTLTALQNRQLFDAVMEDYADITPKSERIKHIKNDRYYNALQIKFAYAVTCHKAQGGSWAHVYVDQGYMTDDMLTPDYIHWLYTAFTRATEKLFLVNWPETQTRE